MVLAVYSDKYFHILLIWIIIRVTFIANTTFEVVLVGR